MKHHGIGLRPRHFTEWLERASPLGLVEVITENVLGRGGRPRAVLDAVRRDAKVALHGVSLNIGGLDPVPLDRVDAIAALSSELSAEWVSDHLCFGAFGGHHAHDLWPIPFSEASLRNVVERVQRVQDRLGRRLVLENVTSYIEYRSSDLPEWSFILELLERADCELLLDLNNLSINAAHFGYDAVEALNSIPTGRVRQLHLAGHRDEGTHLFDTHEGPVPESVWALFEACVRRHGAVPCIVEWDTDVPALDAVVAESLEAQRREALVLAGERSAA